MQRLRANGLDFAYIEQGRGEPVLLLHGFPDTAYTWEHQMPALADAGFRAVAPWLRGYPPTQIPADGRYDKTTLVEDARQLILALGGGKPVCLVGQDWGAVIAYALLAAHPELVRRAVVMAVPHHARMRESFLLARHVHRSFHWWFFQLPELPERALAAEGFAFVDWLWEFWCAPGHRDQAHIAAVRRMLAEPGALAATLGYYRAMLAPPDPRFEGAIAVPTLALCGAEDLRAELMMGQERYFTGPYRFELVAGAGHFLHRERPAAVTRLTLDWLRGPSAP